MELNEEERKEIEGAAENSPVVKRLYEEWKSYQGDGGKEFYKSLFDITRSLQSEFEDIRLGKSVYKYRLLESKPIVWKRIFSLMVNSKKILEGLNYVAGENQPNKIVKISKQKEESEDIPLTDRIANQVKK